LAHAWWDQDAAKLQAELDRLKAGLQHARGLGLRTHAGHGLALLDGLRAVNGTAEVSSTALVAALPDVAELHIGHALIGHSVFVGIRQAIADFKAESIKARRGAGQHACR
jgi:pyridoxine 5-phosphate synthase